MRGTADSQELGREGEGDETLTEAGEEYVEGEAEGGQRAGQDGQGATDDGGDVDQVWRQRELVHTLRGDMYNNTSLGGKASRGVYSLYPHHF